jgi:hypothetical protein
MTIEWHEGPRSALRELFELAEDSTRRLDDYIEDGRVLVARDAAGEIVGHLQLVPGERAGVFEIKNLSATWSFTISALAGGSAAAKVGCATARSSTCLTASRGSG